MIFQLVTVTYPNGFLNWICNKLILPLAIFKLLDFIIDKIWGAQKIVQPKTTKQMKILLWFKSIRWYIQIIHEQWIWNITNETSKYDNTVTFFLVRSLSQKRNRKFALIDEYTMYNVYIFAFCIEHLCMLMVNAICSEWRAEHHNIAERWLRNKNNKFFHKEDAYN